jgi:hypothetical protein
MFIHVLPTLHALKNNTRVVKKRFSLLHVTLLGSPTVTQPLNLVRHSVFINVAPTTEQQQGPSACDKCVTALLRAPNCCDARNAKPSDVWRI